MFINKQGSEQYVMYKEIDLTQFDGINSLLS